MDNVTKQCEQLLSKMDGLTNKLEGFVIDYNNMYKPREVRKSRADVTSKEDKEIKENREDKEIKEAKVAAIDMIEKFMCRRSQPNPECVRWGKIMLAKLMVDLPGYVIEDIYNIAFPRRVVYLVKNGITGVKSVVKQIVRNIDYMPSKDQDIIHLNMAKEYCVKYGVKLEKVVDMETSQCYYIFIQYMDGWMDLFNWMDLRNELFFQFLRREDEGGLLDTNQVLGPRLTIARNLVKVVDELHAINITHGDIKPENVLINPKNLEIRLIDFGSCVSKINSRGVTRHEYTCHHMAPEREKIPTTWEGFVRNDYYSLGSTLFMLFTGIPANSELKPRYYGFIETVLRFMIPHIGVAIDRLLMHHPRDRCMPKDILFEHNWVNLYDWIDFNPIKKGEWKCHLMVRTQISHGIISLIAKHRSEGYCNFDLHEENIEVDLVLNKFRFINLPSTDQGDEEERKKKNDNDIVNLDKLLVKISPTLPIA